MIVIGTNFLFNAIQWKDRKVLSFAVSKMKHFQ